MLRGMFEKLNKVFFGLLKVTKLLVSDPNAKKAVSVGRSDLETKPEGSKRTFVVTAVVGLGTSTRIANRLV